MIEEIFSDEADVCMISYPTPFEIPVPTWLAPEEVTFVFYGE